MPTVGVICSGQDHIQTRGGAVMLYTIWVGGVEAVDYYLTETVAEHVASNWRKMGYTDVTIKKVIL